MQTSQKNTDVLYNNYENFNVEAMTHKCKTEFRFHKNDIYRMAEALRLPEQIISKSGASRQFYEIK